LQPSEYLKSTAQRNIEGEISLDEAKQLLRTYYKNKNARTPEEQGTEEADKVSANIASILAEPSFSFSVVGLTSIHRRIFDGIYKFAGLMRDYDITKREWVLRGDTVLYVYHEDLEAALEYDLKQEKSFSYKGLSMDDTIVHLADFVSGIWQIHPFGEGNTRTTAVFTIKYLRSMGFNVNNDLFADKSWYFRNALVRANYRNRKSNIELDKSFLIAFFRNLLLGEENELRNRDMLINTPEEWKNIANVTKDVTKQLTERQRLILDMIRDDNSVTIPEMSRKANVSERTIKRDITKLQELRLLKREGGRKEGRWVTVTDALFGEK